MKTIGVVLIIVGIIWGIFAFNIDTSIEVGGESYGSGLYKVNIPKTRVNNLGLMNEKQNNIYGAGITLIIGVILFVFASRKEDEKLPIQEKDSQFNIEKDNEERYKVSFTIKDEDSWNNIKINLFAYYKEHNIQNIIADKESSWMLGGDDGIQGYIQATLKENIITIESFKLPKPNIEIINSEIQKKKKVQITNDNDSTNKLIELGKLFEKGLITEKEFKDEKKKIL